LRSTREPRTADQAILRASAMTAEPDPMKRAAQTESAHDIPRELVRPCRYALTSGITNSTVKQVRVVGG
jgi:plasmid stability protein